MIPPFVYLPEAEEYISLDSICGVRHDKGQAVDEDSGKGVEVDYLFVKLNSGGYMELRGRDLMALESAIRTCADLFAHRLRVAVRKSGIYPALVEVRKEMQDDAEADGT